MPSSIPNPLKSAQDLFGHLKIGKGELRFLKFYIFKKYSIVRIPKRKGEFRTLMIPDKRLKYHQREILALLEPFFIRRKPVHGFVKKYSAISNAECHAGRPYLLNLDLKDFFPSITTNRVKGVLIHFGLPEDTIEAITLLCMLRNQLPQGAPTSPILSNMVSFNLDVRLMHFAATHNMRYTRFADDITFSSFQRPLGLFEYDPPIPGQVNEKRISNILKRQIQSSGFRINNSKIWYAEKQSRREVTGLVVNEFTNIKRKFIRNIRSSLFKIERLGLMRAQAEYTSKYKTKKNLQFVVRGKLEFVAQVRGTSFSPYRTLAARYNKLFPKTTLPISPSLDEIISRAIWVAEFCYDDGAGNVICSQGTAVFVKGIGLVTAEHVIDKLPTKKKIDIRHAKTGKMFKATPKNSDITLDLCILDHDVPSSEYLELEQSTSAEKLGDDITALGFPSYAPGDSITKRIGKIEGFSIQHTVKRMQVDCNLSQGMSGGPLLNTRSQVISIIHKGDPSAKNLATLVSEISKL